MFEHNSDLYIFVIKLVIIFQFYSHTKDELLTTALLTHLLQKFDSVANSIQVYDVNP